MIDASCYDDLVLNNPMDTYYRVIAVDDYSKGKEPIHREYYINQQSGEIFRNRYYTDYYGNRQTRQERIDSIPDYNNPYCSVYTTGASYKGFRRTPENVAKIYDLVIDLDAIECDSRGVLIDKHIKLDVMFAQEVLLPLLNEKIFSIVIPMPTAIIHTGRGLQFHYTLENETDTVKFAQVSQALKNKLAYAIREGVEILGKMFFISHYLKLDTGSVSQSHTLFRALNTYNAKTKTRVQILEHNGITHQLDDIIKVYELKLNAPSDLQIGKKKTVTDNDTGLLLEDYELDAPIQKSRETTGTRPNNFKQNNYNITTLINNTIWDLERLQKLRNRAEITSGYRYYAIIIYASFQKMLHHNSFNNYKKNCLDFNEWFQEPLPESEALTYITSIWTQRDKDNPYDLDLNGNTDNIIEITNRPKYIRWKHSTIIQILGITEDEQIELCTIISRKEKEKRKKAKNPEKYQEQKRQSSKKYYLNREDVVEKRNAKAERNIQILDLHKRGFSIRQIADKVCCSKSTVSNVINKNT